MTKVLIPIDKVDNTAPLRKIWQAIDGYEPVRNAFVNAMINKFAFTIVTSKEWLDPWAFTERGYLEYGETIEEVFVNIAKVQSFDPSLAPAREFKRVFPDIKSVFYTMDYQKQYPVTVSRSQLAQAFLSYAGVTDLVARIITSLYTAMEYDKFITKKYMLCAAISTMAVPRTYQAALTSTDTAKLAVKDLRALVKKMGILNKKYNAKGVYNADTPDDIFIVCDADHEAYIDVMVDAQAFHLDKVDWLGRIMVLDSFVDHDMERLTQLFGAEALEELDLDVLGALNFMVITRDTMQVYVNLREMDSTYVGSGRYWNYWLTNWMTFGLSPFAQCTAFIGDDAPTAPTLAITTDVSSVALDTMTPLAATLTVDGEAYEDAPCAWEVEGANSPETEVLNSVLYIAPDETATELTITAISVAYPGATATATATVVPTRGATRKAPAKTAEGGEDAKG